MYLIIKIYELKLVNCCNRIYAHLDRKDGGKRNGRYNVSIR